VLVLRMLQEGTLAGSSPRFSIWVGHFDGLLGYWLVPWGIVLAILMWLTRALWAKNSG
jgi:hypothetical protein